MADTWLDGRTDEKERAIIDTLITSYIETCYDGLRKMAPVVPVRLITMVQTVLGLMECWLSPLEEIQKDQSTIEHLFVFAMVRLCLSLLSVVLLSVVTVYRHYLPSLFRLCVYASYVDLHACSLLLTWYLRVVTLLLFLFPSSSSSLPLPFLFPSGLGLRWVTWDGQTERLEERV